VFTHSCSMLFIFLVFFVVFFILIVCVLCLVPNVDVSLDYPFLIALSVFSDVYLVSTQHNTCALQVKTLAYNTDTFLCVMHSTS